MEMILSIDVSLGKKLEHDDVYTPAVSNMPALHGSQINQKFFAKKKK